jgi:glycosyltransferase involved in cell wall biosynthesis
LHYRPRLTVALPTCNGARHLREALLSIRAQERVAFDLIVSDDRSDDDTLAVVREEVGDHARISVNSERLGLAGNWNQCVTLSRTDWVAIFHQDDMMRPGHLAAHLAAFEADPLIGFVASDARVVDAEGREVPESIVERGGCGMFDRVDPPGVFVCDLAVANPLRCSAVTINAKAHAEVGGFDPSYRYVVDWDFWLRVARVRPISWLSKPTVAIRWHSASETHRFKTGTTDLDETIRLLKTVYETFYERDDWKLPDLKRLRLKADRRIARAFLNRAYVALKGGDSRLARTCLARSIRLSPAILGTIALDPRLAAQMAALTVAPEMTARWLGNRQA